LIPLRITGDPIQSTRVTFKREGATNQLCEILGTGKQIVFAGIHPMIGQPYRWYQCLPDVPGVAVSSTITACPVVTSDDPSSLVGELRETELTRDEAGNADRRHSQQNRVVRRIRWPM